MLANEIGVSRATFYRIKRDLKANGYIKFDEQSKAWGLATEAKAVSLETRETETKKLDGRTDLVPSAA